MADQGLRQPTRLPEYYRTLEKHGVKNLVRDMDDLPSFRTCQRSVQDAGSQNFFIDFSDDEAWCGCNVNAEHLNVLLKAPRPPNLNTRWINIWLPHEQKDFLEVLARNYDFSPRLLGLMISSPLRSTDRSRTSESSSSSSKSRLSHLWNPKSTEKSSPVKAELDAPFEFEASIGMTMIDAPCSQQRMVHPLSQYLLANELYYYTSMDWGRRYICIGYNTLHEVACGPRGVGYAQEERQQQQLDDRPSGKRVWNWILLCDDKTVVTVQEDTFGHADSPLSFHELKSMETVRRNVFNVFRQCSKVCIHVTESMPLPLRHRLGDSDEETMHRATDVPGLLFFYLFADEISTYSLIVRREHRYTVELNAIRLSMFSKAELAHIDRLHHTGRQLAVLMRMYEGYELLIDRLLEKREPTLASLKNSAVASGDHSLTTSRQDLMTDSQVIGVSLSSAARVRFERLKQNVRLYAISEIEECLRLKESLVMMNFNLIAIKESRSVERLTRVTLLLAKLTFLFMPVSIVTAYFSCQFVDAHFTVRSYWSWFAGIGSASLILLIIFSLGSGTLDADIMYKPLSRRLWECISCFALKHRRSRA